MKSLEQKLELVERELAPMKAQLCDAQETVRRLEEEVQTSKQEKHDRIDQLSASFSEVQSLHLVKCREVEELQTER